MMSQLSTHNINNWSVALDDATQDKLVKELESGQVIYLPELAYPIDSNQLDLLDDKILKLGVKNISYNHATNQVQGFDPQFVDSKRLHDLISDFSAKSVSLIQSLFPYYQQKIRVGRTSFRPAEIKGRKGSYRKDDTRLHVDSFPSTPMRGERILKVFTNINPHNTPREWRLGQPYDAVMKTFMPRIFKPVPGSTKLLKWLKITKRERSLYDHYMLNIHNTMKKDERYQREAEQEQFSFPANTTWMVFTDLVSHAATSGQHILEQTFYLSPHDQRYPELSPLYRLQEYTQRELI